MGVETVSVAELTTVYLPVLDGVSSMSSPVVLLVAFVAVGSKVKLIEPSS